MEQRFPLGRPGGTLIVREEGIRAAFEAAMPDDKQGLYKAYVVGGGGSLLLGTLVPENGRLHLCRTVPITELTRKGCWPVTRGEARLAFAFGQGGRVGGTGGVPGWSREADPVRLMGDRILAQAAKELHSTLYRRENGGFALAAPVEERGAFPMLPLFCFAHIEMLGERPYAVFHFDAHGCPTFQNKENQGGHTDGVNQEKE